MVDMADHVLTFIFPKRSLAMDCVAELKDKMPAGWAFREATSEPTKQDPAAGEYLYVRNVISLTGPENDILEGDLAAIAGRYSGRLDHV